MDNPGPRLSTVYDLAGLRLHPDGSRVQQSARNMRPRTAANSVRDSRGNWIARDAGGSNRVVKRRKICDDDEGEEQDDDHVGIKNNKAKAKAKDLGTDEDENENENEDRAISQRRGRVKRLQFANDLIFLEPTEASPFKNTEHLAPAQVTLSHPSSVNNTSSVSRVRHLQTCYQDLLKSIHHQATCYYTEKGQLLNTSRQYRRERKERRRLQLQSQASSQPKSEEDQPDNDEENSDEQASDESNSVSVSGRRQPRNRVRMQPRRDMYKRLNGSALIAIGMLLQEHVMNLLEPHLPQGWEAAESRDDDEDDDVESEDELEEPTYGNEFDGDDPGEV